MFEQNLTGCYNHCYTPAEQILASSSIPAILLALNTSYGAPENLMSYDKSTNVEDTTEMLSTQTELNYINVTYYNHTDYLFPNETFFTDNTSYTENSSATYDEVEDWDSSDSVPDFGELIQEFLNNAYLYLMNDSFTEEAENGTFINSTNINTTTFEYFKTTMQPFIDRFESTAETLDTTLSTLYTEITEAVTSIEKDTWTDIAENCTEICPTPKPMNVTAVEDTLIIESIEMDYPKRSRLRSLCWETMFGQELVKLTIMDLIFTIAQTLGFDFFRGLFVRVMNNCWCWDLEKKFPQYGDFKVAENILHLVNNQGMVWMGMFFSPGLVMMNLVKLYILMYLRCWAVLTCNVPHEVIFRASRSNNFYYALLLMMLFLCVLPVGFAIVWVEPSWHCGPFSNYQRIFHIFTDTITAALPPPLTTALSYIASPGIIIPLLVLLILIIYYLVSLTSALREANTDLKVFQSYLFDCIHFN